MTSGWPPSPSVEDEEVALAREHGLTPVASPIHTCEEPQAKGSVDQYPIILDAHLHSTSREDSTATELDREHSSSDESDGPPTPTAVNSEQRFVMVDGVSTKATSEDDRDSARPRSTANVRSEDRPRGRPYVSPIRTNISNDLEEMGTGRRRPPSPYTSVPKQPPNGSLPPNRFSGTSFLSPEYASSDEYHRDRSTGPKAKQEDARSLTDPERPSDRRRHHSRRRRESGIRTERPSQEKLAPVAFDKRSMSYAAAAPVASILSPGLYKQTRDELVDVDLIRQNLASKDSPYSSSAEENTRKYRSKSRHRSKSRPRIQEKSTQGSPYTSSAEESNGRNHRDPKGKLSRRSSTYKKDRPRLDISEQHYSYGGGELPTLETSKRRSDSRHHAVFNGRSYLEPSSAQSPQAMQEYLYKAFKVNGWKKSNYPPRASPNASPFASPSCSPPRTPRGNRNSKDYFDFVPPILNEAPRSRQPCGDDSPWNIIRPLSGVGAPAAGATVPRAVPIPFRSLTAPTDTPSHGSSSKPSSSGQRSRRSSPVQEDGVRPVSRAGSFEVRDDRPISRPSTTASNEQRRASRIPAIVTETPQGVEYRPTSRANYAGPEAPRPISRAYSTTNEETSRPPPAYRAMSFSQVLPSPITDKSRPSPTQRTASSTYTSSTYITPTSASSTSAFPFSNPRPTTFSPVPIKGPPCPVSTREPAPLNLPSCPRSTPVTGYHDWYTVNSASDLQFCPTCMAALGSSRFRDLFVPSFSDPRREIRCAMSRPWLRIAFIQAVKQRRTPQEMTKLLHELSHLPDSTMPCPGKEFTIRKWYQLIDPYDGSAVPGFEVCTACVRNVDLVFPQLAGVFTRSTSSLPQERGCNINTQGKRFLGYIEQLDKAATKVDTEYLRKPDIKDLVRYARRVANIRDCQRDGRYPSSEWHFIPDLPEFTVCGDCFEEVIRPIYDKPIAKEFHKRARFLPTSRESQGALTSCQLYSARMRKVFNDAVKDNDFEALKQAAIRRHGAELGCQARHWELMQDQSNDRTLDIRRNVEVWKSWE
jgi:hypothetical protein